MIGLTLTVSVSTDEDLNQVLTTISQALDSGTVTSGRGTIGQRGYFQYAIIGSDRKLRVADPVELRSSLDPIPVTD